MRHMRYLHIIFCCFVLISAVCVRVEAETYRASPFRKMSSWVKTKINKDDGLNQEEKIADLQIEVGQARLDAALAKKKLDEHNLRCAEKKEELQAIYNNLEQQSQELQQQLRTLQQNSGQYSGQYGNTQPANYNSQQNQYNNSNTNTKYNNQYFPSNNAQYEAD